MAVITAGDHRKRITWAPQVVADARACGVVLDHNGTLAALELLPPQIQLAAE